MHIKYAPEAAGGDELAAEFPTATLAPDGAAPLLIFSFRPWKKFK